MQMGGGNKISRGFHNNNILWLINERHLKKQIGQRIKYSQTNIYSYEILYAITSITTK